MEKETAGEGGGLAVRWVELIVALLIVIGGGVVIADSVRVGATWGDDGPMAGYFPFLTGWALVLSGLWISGQSLWKWRKAAGATFVHWSELKTVLAMLLPTIAYVAMMLWLGLYVASAIYIAAFMMWQGKYRWLPALAVALGVPLATFLLFEVWFLVPLPKGPIEHLLGF